MDLIPSSPGSGAHSHPVPTFIPKAPWPCCQLLLSWLVSGSPSVPPSPPALPCPLHMDRGCPSSCRDDRSALLTPHKRPSAPQPILSPAPSAVPVRPLGQTPLSRQFAGNIPTKITLEQSWHSCGVLLPGWERIPCAGPGATPSVPPLQGSVTRADIPGERDREFPPGEILRCLSEEQMCFNSRLRPIVPPV